MPPGITDPAYPIDPQPVVDPPASVPEPVGPVPGMPPKIIDPVGPGERQPVVDRVPPGRVLAIPILEISSEMIETLERVASAARCVY
jgi:hypothetical protein